MHRQEENDNCSYPVKKEFSNRKQQLIENSIPRVQKPQKCHYIACFKILNNQNISERRKVFDRKGNPTKNFPVTS